MNVRLEYRVRLRKYSKFLLQLPPQCLRGLLAAVNLAAGKFPFRPFVPS